MLIMVSWFHSYSGVEKESYGEVGIALAVCVLQTLINIGGVRITTLLTNVGMVLEFVMTLGVGNEALSTSTTVYCVSSSTLQRPSFSSVRDHISPIHQYSSLHLRTLGISPSWRQSWLRRSSSTGIDLRM